MAEHWREIAKARSRVRFAVAGMVAFAALAVAAAFLLLWPYSPMTLHRLDLSDTVCASEVTAARMEYTLRSEVNRVEAVPVWVAVDVPGIPEGYVQAGEEGTIPGKYFELGRHTLRSPLLRIAPSRPGVWRGGSVYRAHGTRNAVPRTQQTEMYDAGTTTVKRCEGVK